MNLLNEQNECRHCNGNGYRFSIKENFILEAQICCEKVKIEIPSVKEDNCFYFNQMSFDVKKKNTPEIVEKIALRIKSRYFNHAFKTFFFEKLPKLKKEMKHAAIIKNPEDKRLAWPIEEHQVTNIHIFNRNAIFLIMSDSCRKKYTKILNGELIDVPETRVFDGWGDYKCILSGALLCDYDKKIFDACLKLHHENGFVGLKLSTSLNEIWSTLGNKKGINSNNINTIKRSLKRLASVSVEVRSPNNNSFWVGGIIDNVIYHSHENNKYSKIIINFNQNMVPLYLKGAYSTYSFPVLNGLGSYGRRITEFMGTHKEPDRIMSLTKWREVIGVNPEMEMMYFKKRMKEALIEMENFSLISHWEFRKNLSRTEDLIYIMLNPSSCNSKELILKHPPMLTHQENTAQLSN